MSHLHPPLTYKPTSLSARLPALSRTISLPTVHSNRIRHEHTRRRPLMSRQSPPSLAPSPYVRSRSVYNATTASARASQMLLEDPPRGSFTTSEDSGGRRVFNRMHATQPLHPDRQRTRDSERATTASGKKVTRVVVKRRIIRGSSVFRPATEAELDEYLQLERARKMVSVKSTSVDIPPKEVSDAGSDLCVQCARTMALRKPLSKKNRARMSGLLPRQLAGDNGHHCMIDLSELADIDEYRAVAIFLREMRKYQKEKISAAMNERASEKDRIVDRPEKSSSFIRKKEARKQPRKFLRDYERQTTASIAPPKRSFSADDPVLMNALVQQERLFAVCANKRKERPKLDEKIAALDFADIRSKSDLFSLAEHHAIVNYLSKRGKLDSTTMKPKRDDSQTKQQTSTPSRGKGSTDDEDFDANALRVLTAMEPVNPVEAIEDGDARRVTSYHIGTDPSSRHGSRRRGFGRARTNDTGLMGRLRLFGSRTLMQMRSREQRV